MYIIVSENKILMSVSKNVSDLDWGYHDIESDTIYPFSAGFSKFEIDVIPVEVATGKYKYSTETGFEKNEDYVPTEEEKLDKANERISQLEADVATANYALMMGGLI